MRLIDADELREEWLEWDVYDTIEANTVLYSIDDQPTINPEDLRPKGRWIYLGESLFDTVYKCSECGHPEKMSKKCKKKYCPNCGAKMEE